MRFDLQPAYVLHSRPFRDSSLIIEFLTPDYGRVSVVAKGVRANNKTARLKRGLLSPLQPLLISAGGKGELKNLYGVEASGLPLLLRGPHLYSAFYINEVLLRLLKQQFDSSVELFALYQNSLQALAGDDLLDAVLRRFELTLLELLGYGLGFDAAGDTGLAIAPQQYYRLDAEQGFVTDKQGFLGADLIAIGQRRFDGHLRQVAKQLCRQALAFHLGDKPLKSRDLFVRRPQQ